MAELREQNQKATFSSCLGRCDVAPAFWDPEGDPATPRPSFTPSSPELVIDLLGTEFETYDGLDAAREKGPDWVLEELVASDLTGRGGAGFPAHIKWQAIRQQAETERYIVLNADEGEPGTFKDREVILRRPHLVIEGLAIAAQCLEANDIYAYVRGEFGQVKLALQKALQDAKARGAVDPQVRWHFVDGHGALHLRRRDGFARGPGRQAGNAAHETALSGREGIPGQADPDPERRIHCLSAVHSAARRGVVQESGSHRSRYKALLSIRSCGTARCL